MTKENFCSGSETKHRLLLITPSILLIACFPSEIIATGQVRIILLGDSITTGASSTDDCGYRRSLYLQLTNSGYDVNFVGSQNNGIPSDFQPDGIVNLEDFSIFGLAW